MKPKLQIPSSKLQRNLKLQTQTGWLFPAWFRIGACLLALLWSLEPGIWSFAADRPRDGVTTQIGTNRVSITITGGERVITANGLPDHAPGQFPNRGNPNTKLSLLSHRGIPLHLPLLARNTRSRFLQARTGTRRQETAPLKGLNWFESA